MWKGANELSYLIFLFFSLYASSSEELSAGERLEGADFGKNH